MGEMHEKPGHIKILETVDEELQAGGTLRRERPLQARACRHRAPGRAPHERQSARQRRSAAARSADARLPQLRRRGEETRRDRRRGHARHGQVPSRRDEAEPGEQKLPSVQPRREQLEPLAGRARSDEPRLDGGDVSLRRSSRARRPRDGDAERAPVPGLARRLSAHRTPRLLLLLRGVHSHHRFDVQPAREVVEGLQSHSVAAAHRLAQLPAQFARLAAGPQWLLAPGSRLHRPRREQEGRGRARLSAARRQLPALGHRPLPAQPQLHQRRRRRQTARAGVADDGRGDQALHRRRRHLGMGQQRQRRRTGRGDGLLRRCADARNARGGGPHCASTCPS